jgi:hypothetical protein
MPEITAYADFQQSAGFYFETPNPEEEYTDEELLSMAREIIWSGNGPDVWVDTGQLSGDIEVEIANRVPFHENSSNYASDSVTKAATNRMLTQKEIDKTVMLRTPRAAFRIFFTDMKILIPTIVAVGLILKSPVSTFLVDNLGVRGYRLVVAIIAGYAAFKFGEAYGQWRIGFIMGYLEGFDTSTMKVSTF